MLLNLVAIDPGGETGLASAIYNPDIFSGDEAVRYAFEHHLGTCGQVKGEPKSQVVQIGEYLLDRLKKAGGSSQTPYDVQSIIACEGYVAPFRHMRKTVLLPHAIMSMLEFHVWNDAYLQEYEWREQPRQDRLIISAEMLGKWGLWKAGRKWDDAMAALQHLFILARKLEKGEK